MDDLTCQKVIRFAQVLYVISMALLKRDGYNEGISVTRSCAPCVHARACCVRRRKYRLSTVLYSCGYKCRMFSPLLIRGAAAAGAAAAGVALSDRDRRDAVIGATNGAFRFGRAFGYASVVSLDFKYRCAPLVGEVRYMHTGCTYREDRMPYGLGGGAIDGWHCWLTCGDIYLFCARTRTCTHGVRLTSAALIATRIFASYLNRAIIMNVV